ncbi:MAG: glutamate--tRNA ligase [Nanoarchaeota archaeon]|nr:glutamate--tRNA ligase [Nanoarchaeota archaeon]
MEELIKKYVLQNSIKFDGKPNPGAVIGKILGEKPELKKDVKDIAKKVNEAIKDISKTSIDEQREALEEISPELLKEKKHEEKKRELPDFKDTKNVVMRFEPSPSGPLHIGHAYVLSLNSEYCRKYDGKLILRIGDTNPENIYSPAYSLIEKDANWVTNDNISKVLIQSDRLEIYYKYMEKLLSLDKVYVCECDPEEYKQLNRKGEACPCRDLSKEEQSNRWKKMFKGYKQGDAVARVKTDLSHKNPAMRDFPIFRINDSKHPKVGNKFRVWPLMNMAVTVDDIETNVTHVIRAKDHQDNALRQKFIYSYLGKKFPEAIFVGRINFAGMPVSSTKARELIENKTYSGWDDIRLPFLMALKRRGYKPEAIIKYSIDVGVSLNDKTVKKEEFFKTVNAFNKDFIDKDAYRYFFVFDPKEVLIEGAPSQDIELDLHPENKKGGRKFKVEDKFYITSEDYKSIKEGKLYRLMDCLNFVKENDKLKFDSLEYERFKDAGDKIIHWLPKEDLIKVEVLMEDNKLVKGVGEAGMKDIKVDDVVQLERYSFVRLDKKEKNKLSFWYAHK